MSTAIEQVKRKASVLGGVGRMLPLACLALAAFAAPASHAQAPFPNHAIRMVVAYAPGGSTDIVGRIFAQELGTLLGQSVVVENRAGGGTLIGTDTVIRAPADGYTLFFGTPATVITPLLHNKTTYDVVKDLQPVSLATIQSMGVLVTPSLGIDSIADLVKYAKANPGKLNFASSGNGSAQHLAAEALSSAAGIQMLHVPYKGAGEALNDLLTGRVHMMITSLVGNMTEHVKQGRLKLLATTGPERSSSMPDIPTVAEGGVKDFGVRTWTALFAPANTPKAVVDRLNKAMLDIQRNGVVQKKIESQAMDVKITSPDELKKMLVDERDFYSDIVKRTGAKLD